MRAVFGLVLIIGLGLAGFAVYMVKGYFDQQQAALNNERANAAQIIPTVDVIAVNRHIEYGETLTIEDVQIIKYVKPFLPEGVFLTAEELFPAGGDKLRVVLLPMAPFEPVLAVKVTEPGGDAGLTSRLAKGMRAYAVRVDVASGVSGFLRPGDRVDIYWTGRGIGGEVTKLIETGVSIIAVDQSSESNFSQALVARTVTVEVTPAQVGALALAQSTGSLSLSLVGIADDTVSAGVEVDQASLLGIQAIAPEEVPEEAKVCTIRTRRGAEVVEIPIPCSN